MDRLNFYSLDFLGIHPLHLSFHTGLYRVVQHGLLGFWKLLPPCCLAASSAGVALPTFPCSPKTLLILPGAADSHFISWFWFYFPFILSWGEKSQLQTLPVQECTLNARPWAVGSGNFRWDLAAGSQPRQGSHVRPGPHLLFPSPRRQRNVLATGSFCHDSLLSA